MSLNRAIKRSVSFLGLLLALVACTPISSTVTIATPNPSPTLPMIEASTSAVPISEPLFIPLQPTPQSVIFGEMVESGPFLFDLRLFYDATLNQQPIASSLYSDMNGIGSFMYWCYQGNEPSGPIETYWGTLPQLNQLLQETYVSVQPGSCGGRTGGIMLPGGLFLDGESKVGDQVQVALKVKTVEGEFGAVLIFTLAQGSNGFEPTDISVRPLH
jgi:hypothetical protein